jgi:hypothetical protein
MNLDCSYAEDSHSSKNWGRNEDKSKSVDPIADREERNK